MPLEEPAWWYAADGERSFPGRLFGPVGDLYATVVEKRFKSTTPFKSELPVICVGNFTAGGTGKTPLTRYLISALGAHGLTAAGLTRGYGGSVAGPLWVERGIHSARDVGDEPLLLAADARVMVARDRAAGLARIASEGGIDAVILDDGLQNPTVTKSLSIAVVDARRGIGNGLVIPAGPLRARLSFQLSLVDCIVVMGDDPPDGASMFERLRARFPGPVLRGQVAPQGDTSWIAARTLIAYAGIANPERFFRMLEGLGAAEVRRRAFSDHHLFSDREADALMREAEDSDALLVTTEKDFARLVGHSTACGALAAASMTLPIAVTFDERDLVRLQALLDGVLKGTAQRRGA